MPKKDKGVVGTPVTFSIPDPAGGVKLETFIPWTLVKRGVKRQVITPLDAPEHFREEAKREQQVGREGQDSPMLKALGLAHYWQQLLHEGRVASFADIAAAEGLDKAYVARICRLAYLAPEIIETCLSAGQGELTLERSIRQGSSRDWTQQCQMILSAV